MIMIMIMIAMILFLCSCTGDSLPQPALHLTPAAMLCAAGITLNLTRIVTTWTKRSKRSK